METPKANVEEKLLRRELLSQELSDRHVGGGCLSRLDSDIRCIWDVDLRQVPTDDAVDRDRLDRSLFVKERMSAPNLRGCRSSGDLTLIQIFPV